MDIETRMVRQIGRTKGTLTNSNGKTVPVHFDLTQTQAIINGIPRQRTASGTLEFANRADADLMYDSPEAKTLKGGDIQAQVHVVSEGSFEVTGTISDV